MAKVVSFVVCDAINNFQPAPNQNISALVAPQIVLRPQFIPGNFSFGIAVGIADVNLHTENRMRFDIINPNGEVVQNSGENVLPPVAEPDTLPAQYQGFMINIDIRNLTIVCEGEYKFLFYINGECIGEQMVPIYKRVV